MLQLLANIIITTSIYSLIAISFSIIFSSTKVFNITLGAIITIGSYLTYLFYSIFSLPLCFSILLAIIFSIGLGVLIEILLFKKMRLRNLPKYSVMIASIGLYTILQNSISLFFGDETKIINNTTNQSNHLFFGIYITTIQIITIIVSITLFLFYYFFSLYTSVGKQIRAVSNNSELSETYGIDVNKIIILCFIIASLFASLAGILSALDTNMTPTFGFNLFMYGVVAFIIGGTGSNKGIIFGSILVASSQHLAAYYIETKWMDAIAYIILILFLLWKPLGFSGQKIRKIEI